MAASATRIQKVRRKRFLEKLRNDGQEGCIAEVLRHPCGGQFHAALAAWARTPGTDIDACPKLTIDHPEHDRCRASVIINTVDRAADLEVTLADLHKVWDPSQDELIIVLGPTEDASEKILQTSRIPHRLLRCEERNLSVSRNIGLAAASGRQVVFIDDDASPEPGWLDALLAPFEKDAGVAVAAGFVMDGQGQRELNSYVVADTLGRAQSFATAEEAGRQIERAGAHRSFLTATGCNMAFTRSHLSRIGGFDPAYPYFLEETDAVRRLLLLGFLCKAAPTSRVRHRLGSNIVRRPRLNPADSLILIRSQLHYIGKFGKSSFSPAEIEACLWLRVLGDLERLAWDCGNFGRTTADCAEVQDAYLRTLTTDLGLDSNAP
jgi:GT2 family glycosyltransferase